MEGRAPYRSFFTSAFLLLVLIFVYPVHPIFFFILSLLPIRFLSLNFSHTFVYFLYSYFSSSFFCVWIDLLISSFYQPLRFLLFTSFSFLFILIYLLLYCVYIYLLLLLTFEWFSLCLSLCTSSLFSLVIAYMRRLYFPSLSNDMRIISSYSFVAIVSFLLALFSAFSSFNVDRLYVFLVTITWCLFFGTFFFDSLAKTTLRPFGPRDFVYGYSPLLSRPTLFSFSDEGLPQTESVLASHKPRRGSILVHPHLSPPSSHPSSPSQYFTPSSSFATVSGSPPPFSSNPSASALFHASNLVLPQTYPKSYLNISK
jgi:hypothetical protein